MIYGVGTDVVEIARIEQALRRFGERFARRILCDPELKRFHGHSRRKQICARVEKACCHGGANDVPSRRIRRKRLPELVRFPLRCQLDV